MKDLARSVAGWDKRVKIHATVETVFRDAPVSVVTAAYQDGSGWRTIARGFGSSHDEAIAMLAGLLLKMRDEKLAKEE